MHEKDELMLMPQGVMVQVRGIETKNCKVSEVPAGTICEIGLKLPSDFDVSYLKKGNVLCDHKFTIPLVRKFVARIVVFDLPFGAISKGELVMVHCYTSKCPGKIISLLSLVDQNTGTVIKERPKFLKQGQFANISIKLEER